MNRIVKALAVTAVALSATTGAFAQTHWQKDHPRRAEVNHRLANQNKRIHNEVKEGDITKGQARQMHREDHQIRQEERDMAAQNGGAITRQEQRTLNQQENQVSRQIGK
jgi:CRISPR/Cas system-associated endoribonuclease Cas2